jgi:hypothetical protein
MTTIVPLKKTVKKSLARLTSAKSKQDISRQTLAQISHSVANMKAGKVTPIDLEPAARLYPA